MGLWARCWEEQEEGRNTHSLLNFTWAAGRLREAEQGTGRCRRWVRALTLSIRLTVWHTQGNIPQQGDIPQLREEEEES
jgi:hypothetical protein